MYVYILHFRDAHYHAKHYTGVCRHLGDRLGRHESGEGACLTAFIRTLGIGWTVGAIATVDLGQSAFEVERRLKNIKHAARYCEICSLAAGKTSKRIYGTTPLDRSYVPCDKLDYIPTTTPPTTPDRKSSALPKGDRE